MIYLIRHGETNLNRERKFYGELDISLNDKGIVQGQSLQEQLNKITFSKIYTSHLKRTIEMAELVTQKSATDFIMMRELGEKGFGLWEGLSADEIEATFPKEWAAWLEQPFTITPPQAESFVQFKERVEKVFRDIYRSLREEPETNILIVSHLGVLRLICQLVEKDQEFWDIDIPQGTYKVIDNKRIELI